MEVADGRGRLGRGVGQRVAEDEAHRVRRRHEHVDAHGQRRGRHVDEHDAHRLALLIILRRHEQAEIQPIAQHQHRCRQQEGLHLLLKAQETVWVGEIVEHAVLRFPAAVAFSPAASNTAGRRTRQLKHRSVTATCAMQ